MSKDAGDHAQRVTEILRRKNSVRRTQYANHNTRLLTITEIRPIVGQPMTPELYEEMDALAREYPSLCGGKGEVEWQKVLARHRASKLNWFRRALRWMRL